MASVSLPTPTLRTARLGLRPFNDTDANALFALHNSAYVLRYWDAPPWSERVRAEKFITTCRQMAEEGTGTRLAVVSVSDGAFIGWCSLTPVEPGLPQRVDGLLPRRCSMGPQLRDGGRARLVAVGI